MNKLMSPALSRFADSELNTISLIREELTSNRLLETSQYLDLVEKKLLELPLDSALVILWRAPVEGRKMS